MIEDKMSTCNIQEFIFRKTVKLNNFGEDPNKQKSLEEFFSI